MKITPRHLQLPSGTAVSPALIVLVVTLVICGLYASIGGLGLGLFTGGGLYSGNSAICSMSDEANVKCYVRFSRYGIKDNFGASPAKALEKALERHYQKFEQDNKAFDTKLYIITPTYARLTQRADLTRLYYTLRLIPNLHWVIVEDAESPTQLVSEFLRESDIEHYTQLAIKTPKEEDMIHKISKAGVGAGTEQKVERFMFHRGVDQRNLALKTVKELVEKERESSGNNNNEKIFDAVVYLCDDDNAYDEKLFEEIRKTKMISVFPVAFVGVQSYEGPKVSSDGKVVGWHVSWHPERDYPTDMAGFAFHADLLFQNPMPLLSHESLTGRLESDFLKMLTGGEVRYDLLEPRANNGSKILVWHTRTEVPNTKRDAKLKPDKNVLRTI